LPDNEVPRTTPSVTFGTTRAHRPVFRRRAASEELAARARLLLVAESAGYPIPQAVRDMVTALGGEHLAQIRLEVEGFETRVAVVEVLGYLQALLARQLAVEEMVEAMYRLPTLVVDRFTHHPLP
jgi:hypothetical protein